jgi:uncharacterized membrane-anchored protein
MNRQSLLVPAFVLVVAAQLAVPAWMIVGRELTLSRGTQFKFRTQPVDPADYFRGRYVQLRLEPDRAKSSAGADWRRGRRAYAALSTDSNGYASVTWVSLNPPRCSDYVAVRVGWVHRGGTDVQIDWPMDRFYMEESKAPAAENAYRQHSSATNSNCHVTVRVLNGNAVVEDLYIDGKPIGEYLRRK